MSNIARDTTSQARTGAPWKAGAEAKKPLVPPEPKFWKRYSPHHEFPLSLVASIFLHAFVFGVIGLILTGAILTWFRPDRQPMKTDVVALPGGGGGNPGIIKETGPAIPQGHEAIPKEQTPAENSKPDVPSVEDKAKPEVPKILNDPNSDRRAELHREAARSRLQEIGRRADKMQQAGPVPKGPGKPGGTGPGPGNDRGPGHGTIVTQQQKRRARWTLRFERTSAESYVRQLDGLGAILGIPQKGSEYLIIRNLRQRPAQPRREDIDQTDLKDRIVWYDEAPSSVASLAEALGIHPIPPAICAFFPPQFEELLRKREKEKYPGDEDNIELTVFHIEQRGGHYEPVVESVRTR